MHTWVLVMAGTGPHLQHDDHAQSVFRTVALCCQAPAEAAFVDCTLSPSVAGRGFKMSCRVAAGTGQTPRAA